MRSPLRPIATMLLLAVCTVLIGTSPEAAKGDGSKAQRKLDRHLAKVLTRQGASARVIVRTKPGKTGAVAGRLEKRGKKAKADLPTIDAFAAEVTTEDLADLIQDADVAAVSTDAEVAAFADKAAVTFDGDTLTQVLGIDGLELQGDGIGIAVLDSGIDRRVDLDGGRTDKFWNYIDERANKPHDDYGHGTHVAGIVGGTGKHSKTKVREFRDGKLRDRDLPFYAGVAPKANVYSFKVLDANGVGYTSAVIRALEFIVANRAKLKIDIVNLSLGHPVLEPAESDPLVLAVEQAVRAGLVVVVSAGNYGRGPDGTVGYAGITSPGNAPSAITVGAYDSRNTVSRLDDEIPAYSSRGPSWFDAYAKPDIVAPGHGIVASAALDSTLFQGYPSRRVFDKDGRPGYLRLSGTSMAAATTSGAVALILEANRKTFKATLPPNAVKAILQYSAFPMSGYDGLTQGTGALNVRGALELASRIDPTTAVGSGWLLDEPVPATEVDGIAWPWSQAVIWGNAVLWGNTVPTNHVAWNQAVIWGNAVLWGNTVLSGSAVIWGNNVVWDDPGVWANAVIWGNTSIGTTDGTAVIWGNTEGLSPETVAWGEISRK